MKLDKLYLLPVTITTILVLILIYKSKYKVAQQFFYDYWCLKIKPKVKLSIIIYLLSMFLLAFSILDLRGKPTRIKANIPQQKTVILIDNSLSMMAEDVRPNRLSKAILLARHFVKKAIGHNISVLLFSDNHKKLVPFTTDIELLDSRISGLSDLKITKGGTNINLAIKEAMSYLRTPNGFEGNLLIISDAEDNEVPVSLNVPDSVTIGFVGIGTKSGGTIPMKTINGLLMGNKKFNGKDVVSKLSEEKIKKLSDSIKNYKWWTVTSYSMPTEEMVAFYNSTHKAKYSQKDIIVKPVLGDKLVFFFLILLGVSCLLKFGRKFKYVAPSLLIIISFSSFANDKELKKQKALSDLGVKLNKMIASGESSKEDRMKYAEELLKAEQFEKANILYNENKPQDSLNIFNETTSILASGQTSLALSKYKELLTNANNPEIKKLARENILRAIKEQKQQKQQKQQDQKEQKDQKNNQGQSGDQQKKDSEKSDSKQEQKSGQNNEKQKENEKPDEKKQEKSELEKLKEKKRLQQKMPSILKQLVQDDRQLQKKLLDTSTEDKARQRDKKDW